ncbi:MAG: hypothetical protein M3347_06145, partial [Armatimonadota bacterium]|nr:hypothetical protein [Armatimonadota bacterium]
MRNSKVTAFSKACQYPLAGLLIMSLTVFGVTTRARATPVVFRVSDPIEPSQTALLFGDGIGPTVTAEGWRVLDSVVTQPPAKGSAAKAGPKAESLEVLQASDVCAKVLLPVQWKPGLFAVRLKNQAGASDVIWLNRTEPWWWLGGANDTAVAGEEIRVFGKNFGDKTRAWL